MTRTVVTALAMIAAGLLSLVSVLIFERTKLAFPVHAAISCAILALSEGLIWNRLMSPQRSWQWRSALAISALFGIAMWIIFASLAGTGDLF